MRVTQNDLAWWLATAADLEWTRARTYEDTAPHAYVVHEKTKGLELEDYVRAAAVILAFGQPGRFHRWVNVYLHDKESGYKWWSCHIPISKTTLINRDPSATMYGNQDLPTWPEPYPGQHVGYEVPTEVETLDPSLAYWLMCTYRRHPWGPPMVLDVECSTGALLTAPDLSKKVYLGLSSNRAALNALLMYRGEKVALEHGDWRDRADHLSRETFRLVTYVNQEMEGEGQGGSEDILRLASLVQKDGHLVVKTELHTLPWCEAFGEDGEYKVWRNDGWL